MLSVRDKSFIVGGGGGAKKRRSGGGGQVTNYGKGGGATKWEGGASEVLPLQKGERYKM